MPKQKLDAKEVASPSFERIKVLNNLFPEVFSEGKVDIDKLKMAFGDMADDRPERYSFTWVGKRDAIRLLQEPGRGMLLPCSDESIDWNKAKNIFIEGENLEVLKLLYKSYAGRVKMIYIDPPYNTGNDFIYPDNYADPLEAYLKITGQRDSEGNLMTNNPETSGRYHSAWLSMMYPRLFMARQLLSDDGVILVSIADHEVHNLKMLLNELFGEENHVATFTWKSRAKPTNAGAAKFRPQKVGEYILVYGKKAGDDLTFNVISAKKRTYPHEDKDGKFRTTTILTSNRGMFRRETMRFEAGGYSPDEDNRWKAGEEIIKDLFARNRIMFNEDGVPVEKKYEHEESEPLYPIYCFMDTDLTGTAETGKSDLNEVVGNQHGLDTVKPVQLIKYLCATFSSTGDIILDFFAGSATTGQAVLELNREELQGRKFILIQLPEIIETDTEAYRAGFRTVADIAKRRLAKVVEKLSKKKNGDKNAGACEALDYRVFKLANSNFRQWKNVSIKNGKKYADQVEAFLDPLISGWKAEGVVWEVAIKEGYSLSSTVEKLKGVKGNKVWRVLDPESGQSFRICLDGTLKDETIKMLNLGKDDIFVCRDVALDDSGISNLALQCRLKTI